MLVESQKSPSWQLFWTKTWVQFSPLPALGRHVPSVVEVAPEQKPVVHSTALLHAPPEATSGLTMAPQPAGRLSSAPIGQDVQLTPAIPRRHWAA
jgi:hypothetical protein